MENYCCGVETFGSDYSNCFSNAITNFTGVRMEFGWCMMRLITEATLQKSRIQREFYKSLISTFYHPQTWISQWSFSMTVESGRHLWNISINRWVVETGYSTEASNFQRFAKHTINHQQIISSGHSHRIQWTTIATTYS